MSRSGDGVFGDARPRARRNGTRSRRPATGAWSAGAVAMRPNTPSAFTLAMSGASARTSASVEYTAMQSRASHNSFGSPPRATATWRSRGSGRAACRQVERVGPCVARHHQGTTPCVERHRRCRLTQLLVEHCGRRERRVSTQIDFHFRREPAQVVLRGPVATKNAVSARLFSAAIACIVASASQVSSGHTAAGLPRNTSVVNASTW